LDQLQGYSRKLVQALESHVRGPLIIGTILDSLITFRILFLLIKEVNLLSSRFYIPQLSLSTIISGSRNTSPKGLYTPLHNVLYIQSTQSLSLICHYLTLVLILRPQSLLISFLLGDPLHLCKKAKLQAGIKPTALCSVINKENLIEFPLDSLYYLYNYYMVCVFLSHAYHVTYHVTVTSCDVML